MRACRTGGTGPVRQAADDGRTPSGWHSESGLPPRAVRTQTSEVTDTSTRPARPVRPTTPWERRTRSSTVAELLLGLSFFVTVGFAGYGAATGHTSAVAQLGAVVFLVTLTVVVVRWFVAVDLEDVEAR